jgi:hypothetical protein
VRKLSILLMFLAVPLLSLWPISISGLVQDSHPATFEPIPLIVHINREYVRPGKDAEYNEIEIGAAHTCAELKCPENYLTIESMTGPRQVWFLVGFNTYAAMNQASAAYEKNSELLLELARITQRKRTITSPPENITARYLVNVSRNADPNLAAARYLAITTVKVSPDHKDDFYEIQSFQKSAHIEAGVGHTHLIYQAVAGDVANYYIVTPLRDPYEPKEPTALDAQIYANFAGAERNEEIRKLAAVSIISSDTKIFAFAPPLSYLPEKWFAADPEFWGPAGVAAPSKTGHSQPSAQTLVPAAPAAASGASQRKF